MKMNIQKSRLAAVLTMALVVCMMVSMLALPASAATTEKTFYWVEFSRNEDFCNQLHEVLCGCDEYYYAAVASTRFCELMTEDGLFICGESTIEGFCRYFNCSYDLSKYPVWTEGITNWYELPIAPEGVELDYGSGSVVLSYVVPEETLPPEETTAPTEIPPQDVTPPDNDNNLGIADAVTPELLTGVLDEIVSLLPIVIPVMIGCIGLGKAISFITNVLRGA